MMGGIFGGASVFGPGDGAAFFVRGMGQRSGITWYLITHMWYLKKQIT